MASAKDLIVQPIRARVANEFIKMVHYSGKVVPNSTLHFGVYWENRLAGCMSFGPSINKKGTIRLVGGTKWNGFVELNRLAFTDRLPRNSESRALSVAFRLIKKHAPWVEWVVSFADACVCGDGTIYRAAGFVLTDIRPNSAVRRNPATGESVHIIQAHHKKIPNKVFKAWKALPGHMLRYIYFLDPTAKARLTVPILPYNAIGEAGAGMYKGKPRAESIDSDVPTVQAGEGGANPTSALCKTVNASA